MPDTPRLKTEKSRYLVTGTRRTHIWLQVLEGPDEGIRISIPRYHDSYTDAIRTVIESVTEGDTVTAVLASDTVTSPNWRLYRVINTETHRAR